MRLTRYTRQMRLDEYVDGLERDETVELRKLAEEKSYAITDHLEAARTRFDETLADDAVVGSTAPSVFVGRSSYPDVSTGLLAPVGDEADADSYVTSGAWYRQGFSIEDIFEKRSGLLNSTRRATVDVEDVWDGFVGTQREVAVADRPVDVELGLEASPGFDLDASLEDIAAPRGPRADAEAARLTENPHVPRAVEKTLSDDDWRAEGAITYLYRRSFDVYDVRDVLSVGALGHGEARHLVPTRWSITAVDDTVGQYLRGQIRNAPTVGENLVWHTRYVGNDYWIIAAPGDWEFELLELKAPGSIWNPDPDGDLYMAADREGYGGTSRRPPAPTTPRGSASSRSWPTATARRMCSSSGTPPTRTGHRSGSGRSASRSATPSTPSPPSRRRSTTPSDSSYRSCRCRWPTSAGNRRWPPASRPTSRRSAATVPGDHAVSIKPFRETRDSE